MTTQDPYNQQTVTWVDQGTFWANVSPLSGRSLENAKELREDISHLITLRYLGKTQIYPEDRLVYKTRIFNIAAVLNMDEQNRTLNIFCTESGIQPRGAFTIYWGTSTIATLDEAGVLALSSTADVSASAWRHTYTFAAGGYKYLVLPGSLAPVASAQDPTSGFAFAMAGTADGYTSGTGTVHYQVVTVAGVSCRVYRSEYQLGGVTSMAVT